MVLVKLVLKRGVPISEAIEELGLKITTARFIINKYKETGTFPRRKFKKRASKPKQLPSCKLEEK
jgi:transposase